MPATTRRFFLLAVPLFAIAGCAGRGVSKIALADVSGLATDALLTALIGSPPDKRSTMVTPEPPLLAKGEAETVLLSTDTAGFVRESRGALSLEEITTIETGVAKDAGAVLKKQGFTLETEPFTQSPTPTPQKTIRATFTPTTEQGGSPQDKRVGKSRTFVLIRLTLSDGQTGAVLRVREFYSGRDAGVRP